MKGNKKEKEKPIIMLGGYERKRKEKNRKLQNFSVVKGSERKRKGYR